MIDLYTAPTSNGLRPKIMLHECGIDYRLHAVDLMAGEHKSPEYLARNPTGLVPTLIDSDGPDGKSLTLSQSMTMLFYLAEKSGQFLPQHLMRDMLYWRDIMSIATDLGGHLMSVLTIGREKEPHQPTMDMFGRRFNDILKVWDGLLSERQYCGGSEVTIADFAMYPVMLRCKNVVPLYAEGCPSVDRWYDEMSARPGVQQGLDFGS